MPGNSSVLKDLVPFRLKLAGRTLTPLAPSPFACSSHVGIKGLDDIKFVESWHTCRVPQMMRTQVSKEPRDLNLGGHLHGVAHENTRKPEEECCQCKELWILGQLQIALKYGPWRGAATAGRFPIEDSFFGTAKLQTRQPPSMARALS